MHGKELKKNRLKNGLSRFLKVERNLFYAPNSPRKIPIIQKLNHTTGFKQQSISRNFSKLNTIKSVPDSSKKPILRMAARIKSKITHNLRFKSTEPKPRLNFFSKAFKGIQEIEFERRKILHMFHKRKNLNNQAEFKISINKEIKGISRP
mmetsp:Transcript_31785/g.28147  ORF Transcript_31785/g.28147 Transcript_31785/m.28147 type:complete len:150 (+) Transcript_31785:547-996(+)